jgi:multidrug efflux pump subunit AcrA (membrane-fusion protein)
MQNIASKEKNFIQRNKWWTALIIIILLSSAYMIFRSKKSAILESVNVEKRTIHEVVSTTGNVKPLSDLDLSFETSGQVSKIAVSVGDKVNKGDFLVSLSNADLVATVEQAKAGLKIVQANLSSLKTGSTPEQIAVNESQVQKAKNDLLNAQISLMNSIRDAYTKSDDAIRNYVDAMFVNPRTQSPTLLFQTDSQLENNIITERVSIEYLLASLNNSVAVLNSTNIDSALILANNNLSTIQTFLQNLAFAANKLSANSSITQATINLWKANISTSRASIDISMNNLSTAKSQYESAVSSLNISSSQLTLIKTGATNDQIKAEEATVEQAKANVDVALARLNKSIIISPISGVISNINAKIGQTMQSGATAISVISYGQYDIEAFIPEADIAKIKIDNSATTTLDAYGSDTFFQASVIKIDPGETVLENVPTYKITLKFASSSDNRIKSGMTANLDILTAEKNNVLVVPSRSVYALNNIKYVKLIDKLDMKKTTEVKVETGIRGTDGYVEIISGLKEGDKIVASPNI